MASYNNVIAVIESGTGGTVTGRMNDAQAWMSIKTFLTLHPDTKKKVMEGLVNQEDIDKLEKEGYLVDPVGQMNMKDFLLLSQHLRECACILFNKK